MLNHRNLVAGAALFFASFVFGAENETQPTSSLLDFLDKEIIRQADSENYAEAARLQAAHKQELERLKSSGVPEVKEGQKTKSDPCGFNVLPFKAESTAEQVEKAGAEMGEAIKEGDAQKMRQLNKVFDALVTEVIPTNIGWGEGCEDSDNKEKQKNEDFFLGIYAGIEGTTIDELKEETSARIGVTAYNQLVRFKPNTKDDGPTRGLEKKLFNDVCYEDGANPICGFGFGMHGWLTALLTSTAEQTSVANDDMSGVPAEDPEIEESFEAELGLFFPMLQKHQTKRGQLLVGPMALASESKLADSSSFNKRYYGGFRFAYSPEFYLDLMYGKTEGLEGNRAEIRYQMPLGNLTEGSRLLLGLAVNTGVSGNGEADDSVRLYLTWNTGFNQLLGM